MNKVVRSHLIEIARKGTAITYQVLSDQCKLGLVMQFSQYDRTQIGQILGEISAFEHRQGRPLISALVISKGDKYQGDGFFKLCEELGFGSWKKLKADIAFEIEHMNACYDFWKNDSNYNQYK